jgi:superfamily II DNA/RNA helicase
VLMLLCSTRKLVVCEANPFVALSLEMLVNYMQIGAQVLHSGLESHERMAITDKFNSSDRELSLLLLTYDVSAFGIDLYHQCSDVVVFSAARTAAIEVQAWGRVCRVS